MKKLSSGMVGWIFPVLLLLSLPLFIWAVLTNRFDLRKKAATTQIPAAHPVAWQSPTVTLEADDFYIYANGMYYNADSGRVSNFTINSDPGNPNYTTLELTWHEDEKEMRLYMYFKADSEKWWSEEIRTYNGLTPGDWAYYHGSYFMQPLGTKYTGDFTIESDNTSQFSGKLHFKNLRLQAFRNIRSCWDRVAENNGTYYWPDGCGAKYTPNSFCPAVITPLTANETAAYNGWIQAGRPYSPRCSPIITTVSPDQACMGKPNGEPCQSASCSACPSGIKCIPSCVAMAGSCQNQQCLPGKPLPTPTPRTPVVCRQVCRQVQCIQAPCDPVCTTVCDQPTPKPESCSGPNGSACYISDCPVCNPTNPNEPCPLNVENRPCRLLAGVCQNKLCLPRPLPTGSPLPDCRQDSDCGSGYFCYQPPMPVCPPNTACPQVMPSRYCMPKPTPTRTPTSSVNNLSLTLFPNSPIIMYVATMPTPTPAPGMASTGSGYAAFALLKNNGQVVTNQTDYLYTWTIDDPTVAYISPFNACTNGITPPCPFDHLSINAIKPTSGTFIRVKVAKRSNPAVALASGSFTLKIMPVSSLTPTAWPTTQISLVPPTPTRTPTPTITNQQIQVRIKFAGVDDGAANGATATLRFTNGTTDVITPPVVFTHAGNGIYQATILAAPTSSIYLTPGSGYALIVKGEKHVARKFCKPTGQTGACKPGESLTILPGKQAFDFSAIPLDPGDLPPQDGRADADDFAKIKNLMNKTCSQLTKEEKKTADLDYDGCINITDAFLMRKTLETRYDEN